MIKIDKNVPLNEKRNKYPFPDMEVGDSFKIEGAKSAVTIRNAAYNWGKVNGGKKFSIRRSGNDSWRIWRVL